MNMKSIRCLILVCLGLFVLSDSPAQIISKQLCPTQPLSFIPFNDMRIKDLPVLKLPDHCLSTVLPPSVDNSVNSCFSGIFLQTMACCEQHHSVSYVFGYEINRLRGLNGKTPENFYPSHYTYNFFNNADWSKGVSYFYSLDVLKTQGQMNGMDYGPEVSMDAWTWPSGYDKYYNGMHNRLARIYTIPVNTEEGQNTLKHYLYDHFDGSPIGGVALFSATAPVGSYFRSLPPGTPEEGKHVMIYFDWFAVHGGTVIGYDDSIRYDINNDGKYTNTIDINGDGKIDIRDWEIGGFRIANSYGDGWGDNGFYYALYSAMAQPYGAGGIENSNVVVLEPMADYQPRLTMNVSFRTKCRSHFSIRAGVSSDTSLLIPEHSIEFPIFNFQGNCFSMQGIDTLPGKDSLELGLDVSPLLSYTEPSVPARFFLIVENRDSLMNIDGEILHLAFINYSNGANAYKCPQEHIPCKLDGETYASVVLSPDFSKLRITNTSLPTFVTGQPYQQQMLSSGGTVPHRWSVNQTFSKVRSDSVFTLYQGSFMPLPNIYKPYRPYALPFGFRFAGKVYDSVWVNTLGLVSFESKVIPYQYTIDDAAMLKTVAAIFPAFSRKYFSGLNPVDSVCISLLSDKAVFRWFLRMNISGSPIDNNLELILYPDGRFETRYGMMTNSIISIPIYTGWSAGDGLSFDITKLNDRAGLANQSYVNTPFRENEIFKIVEEGLLTAQNLDSTKIYSLNVRVEDAAHQTDNKIFQVSNGLGLSFTYADGWDGILKHSDPVSLNIKVSNNTQQEMQNLNLKLVCDNKAVSFQDSVLNIPKLAAGNTQQLNHAFTFRLSGFIPDQRTAGFTLQITSGSRHWTQSIILSTIAPDLNIGEPLIIDGDNQQLDPGEVAELAITLNNTGHLMAENLTMSLFPADTMISILSAQTVPVGQCPPPGNQKYIFLVRASRSVNINHPSIINIKISGSNIPESIIPISMSLGFKRIAIARLSPESVSLEPMASALDSLGIPFDVFTDATFHPYNYSATFLLNATSGNEYLLSQTEDVKFASYLNHGGNLYMEGNGVWSLKSPLLILPYFKFNSARVPAFFFNRVKGCSQSFTGGMNFIYDNPVNGSIYEPQPADGALRCFENTDATPHCLQFSYDLEGYKTIGSLFEFGSLFDSAYPSTQKNLMQKYLDFFNINTSGPYPLFHASNTSPIVNDTIVFLDDSYADIISRQWEFPGGDPASSTLTNPAVSYPASGLYNVTLTVSDGLKSKSLTRKHFINVAFGTGITTAVESGLMIFPNPATDRLLIRFPGKVIGRIKLELVDIRGITVLSDITLPNLDEIMLNTASLSSGLYFLKTIWGEKIWVNKVIINK